MKQFCPTCGSPLERMAKLPRLFCRTCGATFPASAKANKYHVSPKEDRTVHGHIFASKAEANRYLYLAQLERMGEITGLELQPDFLLQEPFTDRDGTAHRGIHYRADFSYRLAAEPSVRIVEDVKGMKTQAYSLKKKMLLSRYPDIKFVEVKA